MPVYHCEDCRFTFKRETEVKACPDWVKPEVRPASKDEIAEFNRDMKEEN